MVLATSEKQMSYSVMAVNHLVGQFCWLEWVSCTGYYHSHIQSVCQPGSTRYNRQSENISCTYSLNAHTDLNSENANLLSHCACLQTIM